MIEDTISRLRISLRIILIRRVNTSENWKSYNAIHLSEQGAFLTRCKVRIIQDSCRVYLKVKVTVNFLQIITISSIDIREVYYTGRPVIDDRNGKRR